MTKSFLVSGGASTEAEVNLSLRLETFLTLFCPLKLDALMKQVSQRSSDLGEVLDELTAIASESEKTYDLLDILRRSTI